MQRIEYIHLRLCNWAEWKVKNDGGGRGFSAQSTLCGIAVRDRYREATIPIDDPDAVEIQSALDALQVERAHLVETVHLYYLGRRTLVEVGIALQRGESTIRARLCQVDHAIAAWLRAKRAAPIYVKGSIF